MSDEARKMVVELVRIAWSRTSGVEIVKVQSPSLTALCELLLAVDAWDNAKAHDLLLGADGKEYCPKCKAELDTRDAVNACRKLGLVP
jgi:hypothetical protein